MLTVPMIDLNIPAILPKVYHIYLCAKDSKKMTLDYAWASYRPRSFQKSIYNSQFGGKMFKYILEHL